MEFEKSYWDDQYADIEVMDCIGNGLQHMQHLKWMLALENIPVRRVVGLGYGLGYFFKEVIEEFDPIYAAGVEVSKWAFKEAEPRLERARLYNMSIAEWLVQPEVLSGWPFDLGICAGVLHYLDDDQLKFVLPGLANRVGLMYATIPTLEQLAAQDEIGHVDPQAIRRPAAEWRELLSPHFAIVGNRFLESRALFSQETSMFRELVFRTDA